MESRRVGTVLGDTELRKALPGGQVGGRMNIDELLDLVRERLNRVEAEQAADAVANGAVIVDIRIEAQQRADGMVPGAIAVNRNELEWLADPNAEWFDPRITNRSGPLIIMCAEGYASSLAADTMHQLGVVDATDMIDGFKGWREAGLPTEPLKDEDAGKTSGWPVPD
jgi:rhodanese-related sulfurtransferase